MSGEGVFNKLKRYRVILSSIIILIIIFLSLQYFGALTEVAFKFTSNQSSLYILGVLFAVTFASYSLLFLVLPYIRKSLAKSNTVGGIGYIFIFTIYLEIFSIAFGFVIQIDGFFQSGFNLILEPIYLFLSITIFIMLGTLSYYLHLLFEDARKERGRDNS